MSLARIKVWNPGDILTAGDLNAELNNFINNPISLISPTTGAINFNLQAHTNLRAENVATTPTSTSAGRLVFNTGSAQLQVDDGTVLRSVPTIISSNITLGDLIVGTTGNAWSRLGIGSAGQILQVSSSQPVWVTSTNLSVGATGITGIVQTSQGGTGRDFSTQAAGTIIFVATSAATFQQLVIGSSGQVLTVSTNLLPSWAATAGGGGGSGAFASTSLAYVEDFVGSRTGGTYDYESAAFGYYTDGSVYSALSSVPGGFVSFPAGAAAATIYAAFSSVSTSVLRTPFRPSLLPDYTLVAAKGTTGSFVMRIGLMSSVIVPSADPTNGLFFRTTGGSTGTWQAVSITGGTQFSIETSAVMSTGAAHVLRIQVTGTGPTATVFANQASAGTFTSSQVPTADLGWVLGYNSATVNGIFLDGWQVSMSRTTSV